MPRALALLLLLAACARPAPEPPPQAWAGEAPRVSLGGAMSATWGVVR
ncbi:hypothetical protein ACI6QG_08905 [Roseococcus sp. DSY-14]